METTQTNQFTKYAEVIVSRAVNKILDYGIPDHLLQHIKIGSCIHVSVNKINNVVAIVTKIKDTTNCSEVISIHDTLNNICLPEDLIQLMLWMSKYYFIPLYKMINLFLPPRVLKDSNFEQKIFITSTKTKKELKEIIKAEKITPNQSLILKHIAKKRDLISPLKKLLSSNNLTEKDIDPLIEKGILKIFENSIFSSLNKADIITTEKLTLSDEQEKVYKKILSGLLKNSFETHLLFGITGSGKTEVYIRAIEKCLDLNKSALILVPEIALIPQLSEKIKTHFSVELEVIYHELQNELNNEKKREIWLKCLNNQIKILIGTRSALFYPMKNLGLIIVDEEHASSYKQQLEHIPYHGRDVAVMRGKLANCVTVLGSATPSLESYTNALNKKYILSKLTSKPKFSPKLKISIINMKEELAKTKSCSLISSVLITKIKDRLEKGEQSIIFLNRRGFHTRLTCPFCQHTYTCKYCNITLIYHKKDNLLSCHLCGFSLSEIPNSCQKCSKSTVLVFQGIGTEKVELSLKKIFPEINILRIDADTTKKKDHISHLLKDFSKGKADVLVGTQMISKGHHFPLVTLSAILNADSGLLIPDFRSSEVVFQLISQVSGRSGRGVLPGEVLIQTFLPENPIIKAASQQNYENFYSQEITLRKLFQFPPFFKMVKVIISSKSLEDLKKNGFKLFSLVKQQTCNYPNVFIYPFVPCGYSKIKEWFRYQFIIRATNILIINHLLQKVFLNYSHSPKIRCFVDIEPYSTFF